MAEGTIMINKEMGFSFVACVQLPYVSPDRQPSLSNVSRGLINGKRHKVKCRCELRGTLLVKLITQLFLEKDQSMFLAHRCDCDTSSIRPNQHGSWILYGVVMRMDPF